MKSVEEKLIRFSQKYKLIDKRDKILIAVSGGADSVTLLFLLNKLKKLFDIEIGVAHVNHSLRGKDSDDEHLFVHELSAQYGIPFFSVIVNTKLYSEKNKISIEQAARELRYQFLYDIAFEEGYNKIAVAHTLNDNTETVLLNFFKHPGKKGLAGIPFKRGIIIRPMLPISREEVIDICNQNNLSYKIDKSNEELIYDRNFIRHEIIPPIVNRINNNLHESIFNSSLIFRDEIEYEIITLISLDDDGSVFIKKDIFERFEDYKISELIKDIFYEKLDTNISFLNASNAAELFNKQKGKKIKLPGAFTVVKERDGIRIFKETLEHAKPLKCKEGENVNFMGKNFSFIKVKKNKVNFNEGNNVEYISLPKETKELKIRLWEHGDNFIPLGMNDKKKVSEFLTDAKVPARIKPNVPVVLYNNDIIWVVGYRINEKYKVNKNSKNIYRMEFV